MAGQQYIYLPVSSSDRIDSVASSQLVPTPLSVITFGLAITVYIYILGFWQIIDLYRSLQLCFIVSSHYRFP